jgi:hypothetical protein
VRSSTRDAEAKQEKGERGRDRMLAALRPRWTGRARRSSSQRRASCSRVLTRPRRALCARRALARNALAELGRRRLRRHCRRKEGARVRSCLVCAREGGKDALKGAPKPIGAPYMLM